MNTRKLALGALIWTVGISIPLFYHALLINAAVKAPGHSYAFYHIANSFFDLPPIIWPYLIAMTIVGGILVKSGMKGDQGEE